MYNLRPKPHRKKRQPLSSVSNVVENRYNLCSKNKSQVPVEHEEDNVASNVVTVSTDDDSDAMKQAVVSHGHH